MSGRSRQIAPARRVPADRFPRLQRAPVDIADGTSSAAFSTRAATFPLMVRLWAVPEVVRVGLETMLLHHADRVRLQPAGAGERPHVVVVDPLSPDAERLPRAGHVPVIALTWDSSPRGVHRARSLGAVRILPVSTTVAELVETVELVHRTATADAGRTPSSPQAGDHGSLDGLLSGREAQIIERICRGMSNDEIASELYLSINSVKTYIRTAYRKIGVTRRSQAVLWGIEHGL